MLSWRLNGVINMGMKSISKNLRTRVMVSCIQTTHRHEDYFRVHAYMRIGVMHSVNTRVWRLLESTCVPAYWCDVFRQHMGMKIISEKLRTRVLVSCIETTHGYEDYFRVQAYLRICVMYSHNTWVWRLFHSTCVHAYWCDVITQHMGMKIISEYMRTCVLAWCI